jgi:Helix-turn-helix domain
MRALQHGSQCQRILAKLKGGSVITTAQAVRLFECYRLSERIRELRARGHHIHSTMVKLPSKRRVAVYAMDL